MLYVQYNEKTECIGVTGYESETIDVFFKKMIKDQNFIDEFKKKNPIMYKLWWLSCNCGRSIGRWIGWSIGFAFGFAGIFTYLLGNDHFIFTKGSELSLNPLSMLYYSVVTFTTLGFGDIVPRTQIASLFVMMEVVLGYIMLGGLITIMANKLIIRH